MAEMVDRHAWWLWPTEQRDRWTTWFSEHGHDTDDIRDFTVLDGVQIEVVKYVRDEEGKIMVGPGSQPMTTVVHLTAPSWIGDYLGAESPTGD